MSNDAPPAIMMDKVNKWFGQLHVLLFERADGPDDHLLTAAAHGQQATLELPQLGLELVTGVGEQCHQPNLPVMYSSVFFCDGRVNIVSVSPYSMSSPM